MPMTIKMKADLNPGTWFPYEKGRTWEEVGGVCVRVLNRKALKEIEKQTHKKKAEFAYPVNAPENTPAQRFEYFEVDRDLEDELVWDYCITGWHKTLDEDGAEIPCTKENKVKLMLESFEFSSFVKLAQVQLNAAFVAAAKEKEKNSSGTLKATSTEDAMTAASSSPK